jgi:hypothetical protein
MYIPTWLLIIIIAGVFYYFYKRKTPQISGVPSSPSNITDDKISEDWLDSENWKEIAIQHLSKFPQRTGRKRPTYEEILNLDEDEFKAWMFVMAGEENQQETLKEMIAHETKTGSFTKTGKENDPPHVKMIVDVFNKDKSEEIVRVLKNLSNTSNKLIEDGSVEGEKGDIVQQSIWAKATSDYFKLAEKVK